MVADERRIRLEKEDEAIEARSERDALRQAVRVVEEDCKALRAIVESLGARVPESSGVASSSSRAVDLSNSPTASSSSLPPSSPSSSSRLPPRNRSPSPTPRKQRGPPSALLLSPSLGTKNTDIILSPSPTTPSRRIPLGRRNKDSSNKDSSDTSSIHSNYSSSSIESRGDRSPSGRKIPLSPSGQRRVQQLGLDLGLANEDRGKETTKGEGRKRSGTTSSLESLDQLMSGTYLLARKLAVVPYLSEI